VFFRFQPNSKHSSLKSTSTILSLSLFLILSLSACQLNTPSSLPPTPTPNSSTASLEEIITAPHPIALIDNNYLTLVNPDTGAIYTLNQFSSEQLPLTHNLTNFKFSPDRQYIVWYSPQQGFLKLTIASQTLEALYPPSDWLNQNPYFEYTSSPATIHFIDTQGTQIYSIDLSTNSITQHKIPYPFGNIFRIAPDQHHIIYVSGFEQTQQLPQYMFTTLSGASPQRFSTQTALNKRQLITWLPDSSGIITIENSHQLTFIPRSSPQAREPFFQLEETTNITDLQLLEDNLYIFANNKWYVIDIHHKRITGRAPVEIAEDIHRPKFIPWYDHHFLIEETLRLDPEQFNRLWISNFMGAKSIIVNNYHQITIDSQTPSI